MSLLVRFLIRLSRIVSVAHRSTRFILTMLLVGLILPPASPVRAQPADTRPVAVPKNSRTIELDGRITKEEWAGAKALSPVQRMSDFGAEPELKTEILITYTEDHLYLACRCYDPGTPSVVDLERDQVGSAMDSWIVLLDTFNDEETGVGFWTTPAGTRTDAAISNDATGEGDVQWFDSSWNTFWNVEVRRTAEGWFAEMRIPVSSLRFESKENHVVMGLTTWRWVPRKNEMYIYPPISMEPGVTGMWKPSRTREMVFRGLDSAPPLRISPYVLGGLTRRSELNDRQTAYQKNDDLRYDAGLDVKYGLTSNFTLDLTLNTDFAQVEADNQQVNLTRFPLFFPEKRRFFLERSSNFAFQFAGPNRLFYSRRIGLHQGRQVRILGGARVVGRTGPWDVGALAMQTARESGLGSNGGALPSEHFGVMRLRREIWNQHSEVGGILTTRIGLDGSYNLAYGLDGTIRPAENDYVTWKWAQTFTSLRSERFASLEPTRLQVRWQRRTYEGLGYDLRYDRAGRAYRPGLGFELREDYFRFGDRIGYGWNPEKNSWLNRHQINLRGSAFFRNVDGRLQSLRIGPEWTASTANGHSLTARLSRRAEQLRRPFSLSRDISVPPGRYDFYSGLLSYGTPADYDLQIDARFRAGGYFDGRRLTAQIKPAWNPSPYLQVTSFYQINRVTFPARKKAFTAHVSRLKVSVTPSVEHSIRGFVQHSSASDVLVANLRYRYNPRQGNDFYLVYDERLNADRSAAGGRLQAPRSTQRALILKYIRTFNL